MIRCTGDPDCDRQNGHPGLHLQMTPQPTSPRTAAGQTWLVEAAGYMDTDHLPLLRERILAIEAEAAAADHHGRGIALAELVEVRALLVALVEATNPGERTDVNWSIGPGDDFTTALTAARAYLDAK